MKAQVLDSMDIERERELLLMFDYLFRRKMVETTF